MSSDTMIPVNEVLVDVKLWCFKIVNRGINLKKLFI